MDITGFRLSRDEGEHKYKNNIYITECAVVDMMTIADHDKIDYA